MGGGGEFEYSNSKRRRASSGVDAAIAADQETEGGVGERIRGKTAGKVRLVPWCPVDCKWAGTEVGLRAHVHRSRERAVAPAVSGLALKLGYVHMSIGVLLRTKHKLVRYLTCGGCEEAHKFLKMQS